MARHETSEKILTAADALLAEVGYDGASVGRVAERAGVNKALVFYHFESKSKLVEAVLARYYEAHQSALRQAYDTKGDARLRIHSVVDAYFKFMSEHRTYPRLVLGLIAASDEARAMVQDNLLSLFRWTTEMLADITPNGGPLDARQFYSTFSGMVTGYFTYAPVIADAWGDDPLAPESLSARLEHVHWMVDAVLDRLEAER
ncbi:MAG: TetR family transcriptional regulator [Deltaproteobacteria bacterium]